MIYANMEHTTFQKHTCVIRQVRHWQDIKRLWTKKKWHHLIFHVIFPTEQNSQSLIFGKIMKVTKYIWTVWNRFFKTMYCIYLGLAKSSSHYNQREKDYIQKRCTTEKNQSSMPLYLSKRELKIGKNCNYWKSHFPLPQRLKSTFLAFSCKSPLVYFKR